MLVSSPGAHHSFRRTMISNEISTPGRVVVGATGKAEKKKVDINTRKAKDKQLVKGRFNNIEFPGGTFSFVYKAYKGDPVIRYDLKDGEICWLPLGVARHLNNNVGIFQHKYLLDKNGKPTTSIMHRIRRCSFENLEFMDIEDIGAQRIENVEMELPSLS